MVANMNLNFIDKLDEKLFLTLNSNHHAVLDYIMLFASNLLSFIPVFILCAFISIKYFKQQDDGYHPYFNLILLITILVTQYFVCRYLLEDVFKNLYYRDRPCENPDISSVIRLLGRNCNVQNHSLFAFKPCLIFCITSFLFFTIKQGFRGFKLLLVVWSLLVAYSRIYVGAHYPINVLVSGVTGIFMGYFISRFYFYLKYKLFVI
jgi:undecaprenyl-diphosphatase